MDLVQNILKDGRLKIADKSKSRPDGEPGPNLEEVSFIEPVDVFMMDIIETTEIAEPDYKEQLKVIFPKAEKELMDFLNWCKLKDSEEVSKRLENTNT